VKLELEEHTNQTILSFQIRCDVSMGPFVVLVLLLLVNESMVVPGVISEILEQRHARYPDMVETRIASHVIL
jgi:hypothetical protein